MRHDSEHFAALDQAWEMFHEGDLDGALQAALATLEVDEDSPEAHNLAGAIWSAKGFAEKGLRHFDHAIAVDDLFLEALINGAEAALALGRPGDALRRLEDALELADNVDQAADVLLLRVDAAVAMGDGDAASATVAQLPEGPFESPQVVFLIGRAKLLVGDAAGAHEALEAALARGADDLDLHYHLALAREAVGDLPGAMVAFLQCRERDMLLPDLPWTLPRAVFERRVQEAVANLRTPLSTALDGALVVVESAPGAEVVSEGVDPRAAAMMDEVPFRDGTEAIRRLFVYQRNIERSCARAEDLPGEIEARIGEEVEAFLAAPRPPAPTG
ncbi:MAG: tetratricopeptide repeat protein [Myxococcota bacterium]